LADEGGIGISLTVAKLAHSLKSCLFVISWSEDSCTTEKLPNMDEKGHVCNELKLAKSWIADRSGRNPEACF
jgi:hypothetical protein